MPDERRPYGTGRRGRYADDQEQEQPPEQPGGTPRRRRRSMETSGGVSVSDLVNRHTRTDLPRPVPGSGGRRAAPEPPPVPGGQQAGQGPRHGQTWTPGPAPTASRPAPADDPPQQPPRRRRARQEPSDTSPPAAFPPAPQPSGPLPRRARRQAPEPPPAGPAADEYPGEYPPGQPPRPAPRPPQPSGPLPRRARRQAPEQPSAGQLPPGQHTSGQLPRPMPQQPPAQLPRREQRRPQPGAQPTGGQPLPAENRGTGARPVVPPGAQTGGHQTAGPQGPGHQTSGQLPRRGQPPRPAPQQPAPQQPPPQQPPPQQPSAQLPRPAPQQPSAQLPRPAPQQPSAQLPRPAPPQPSAQLPRPGQAAPPGSSGELPQEPFADQAPAGPPTPPPPSRPRPEDIDPLSMTTEMEPIGEATQRRRRVDETLARFSAVHDELAEEERKRREKRKRLMPWRHDDEDEDENYDDYDDYDEESAEDAEGEEEEPREKPKKRFRLFRSRRAGKTTALSVAVLVFVLTGIGWGVTVSINNRIQEVDALDENSSAIQSAEKQTGDENFLLVGSDTRAGATEADGVGTEANVKGARSDTVMIAHIPADRKRVVVVSFPRDLEVTRPACDRWDSKTGKTTGGQAPAAKQVKLNTAYQVGGPLCVTKLVQELSGLRINHFVGIDFNGFKEMVDAVQGVQVCIKQPIIDDTLGVVVPTPGPDVTLTGDQALNFVRARHVQGDPTSDYGRIKRQQRFLSALLRKAMSGQVLLDPGKLNAFINAFAKATFGENIGVQQMVTLGSSLQNLDSGRVTFVTVPTTGTENERHNEVLREKDSKALFTAIINDAPLPGETPESQTGGAQQQAQPGAANSLVGAPVKAQQPTGALVDPKTVKIQVLNGGNPNASAPVNLAANNLRELGFQVVRTGPSPDKVDRTVIRYSAKADEARTLAAAVPGAVLQETPDLGGAVLLVIGPGFDGKVVDPNGPNAGKGQTDPGQQQKMPADLSTVNAGDTTACS